MLFRSEWLWLQIEIADCVCVCETQLAGIKQFASQISLSNSHFVKAEWQGLNFFHT